MNLKDSINKTKRMFDCKPIDNFNENDYFSERFNCGFELKKNR